MLHSWQMRLFVLCCFLLCAVPAMGSSAQPEYRNFDSHISIDADGTLTVQEIITEYIAEGGTRHGLFRDFPMTYRGPNPFKSYVPFTLLAASLDGKPVSTTDIESREGGIRIFVRDNNAVLDKGEHVFSITYKTGLQLGFFEDYDELTWNVTGANWQYPIGQSSCTITLPQGAKGLKLGAWLGLPNARTSPVSMAFNNDGQALFVARRPIEPGEQLTVALAWEKGFVTPEDDGSATYATFVQALHWLIGALVLIFALIWFMWGKDPKGGVIIPRFEPPSNPFKPKASLSAAAMGFIASVLRLEPAHFSALCIGLAVKKQCTFSGSAQEENLRLTRNTTKSQGNEEEDVLLHTAFNSSGDLLFGEYSHERLQKSYAAIEVCLEKQFTPLWQKNLSLIGLMAGLAIAGAGLLLFQVFGAVDDFYFLLVLFALTVFFWCFSALKTGKYFAQWRYESRWGIGLLLCFSLSLPCTVLLALCTFGGEQAVIIAAAFCLGISLALLLATRALLHQKNSLWQLIVKSSKMIAFFFLCLLVGLSFYSCFPNTSGIEMLVLSLLPALFAPHMKRPSKQCRQVLDEIEGLALYIRVAEEDRLNILNPPEHTLQFFEKILPYAVALGLEDAWGKKFSDVIEGLQQDQQAYWSTSSYTAHSITSSVQQSFMGQSSGSTSSSSFGGGGGGAGGGGGGGGGGGC